MANQTKGLRLTFRVADMWTCLSMNMSFYEHVSLWKCLSMNMYLYEHVSPWTCLFMNMSLYKHVSLSLSMNMSLYEHVSLSCLYMNMSLYERRFTWKHVCSPVIRSIVVIIKLIMIKIIKTHKIYKL